jgi:hypothetical protein
MPRDNIARRVMWAAARQAYPDSPLYDPAFIKAFRDKIRSGGCLPPQQSPKSPRGQAPSAGPIPSGGSTFPDPW